MGSQQVDDHRCSKKCVSHVCLACCMCGFVFLAFGCDKIWALARGQKRATAPLAGEGGEQLWGQGEEMENVLRKIIFCCVYVRKFIKLFPVFGPGHPPGKRKLGK